MRGILKSNIKYLTPWSDDSDTGLTAATAGAAPRPDLPLAPVRRRRSEDGSVCGAAGFPHPTTAWAAPQQSADLERGSSPVDGGGSSTGHAFPPPPLRRRSSNLVLSVTRVFFADEDPLSRRVAMMLFQVAAVRSSVW